MGEMREVIKALRDISDAIHHLARVIEHVGAK